MSNTVDKVEVRVKAALERCGLIGPSDKSPLLIVAVSGGPDSVALLHSLINLRESLHLALHVAHLNHDFRGEEAEEDARFVAAMARGLDLPATIEKADVLAYQKERRISSFEAAAREVRYSFLARVSIDHAASAVALGHTLDDLAETVLMNIIRGSGLHGLRGMGELTTMRTTDSLEVMLFRPLLSVNREETVAYCHERGISFRQDSGNLDMRFTRNRIRRQLLPALKNYNPRIKEALLRLARSAAMEVEYLEKETTQVWRSVAREENAAILLDAVLLASLHPFMQRMVLRRAYKQLTGDTRKLEETHLKAMAQAVISPPGNVLTLPRGLKLLTGYGQLILCRRLEALCPFPPLQGEHPLKVPGVTEIPGWRITAKVLPLLQSGSEVQLNSTQALSNFFSACFNRDAVGDGLSVRTRRPGDRFQPSGMDIPKKLQDFLVDGKVPRAWRDRIPLVVSEQGILWVVGYRVAEWGRVKAIDQPCLRVSFSRKG